MKLSILFRSLFVAVVFILGSSTVRALDTNAVLTAWLNSQTNIQSLAADLVQTRKLKALAEPLTAKGKLWFQPPNRFRWELGQPAQTIVVRDTQELFMISPRLKRAERYPMDGSAKGPWNDALSLLESGFPTDAASFRKQYQLRSLVETNGLYEVRIVPTSAAARRMITGILLVMTTNDFRLAANELTLADGSVVRNDFIEVRLNTALAADTFKPPIGADFKIIEPWKKQP